MDNLSNFPFEGLWVSPTGKKLSVVEHIQYIQQNPEAFGLNDQHVDCSGLDPHSAVFKMGNIAVNLISQGWIRYRLFDLTHHFEVNDLNTARKRILSVLETVSWPAGEQIEITSLTPPLTIQENVEQYVKTASRGKTYPTEAHKKWAFSYNIDCGKNG